MPPQPRAKSGPTPSQPRLSAAERRRREAEQAKPGIFARLRAEAEKGRVATEPYVITDVSPHIVIVAPTTGEQQIALTECFNESGELRLADARKFLANICGDSFPRVWEMVRREHVSVITGLVRDIADHFEEDLELEAQQMAGGSGASSA